VPVGRPIVNVGVQTRGSALVQLSALRSSVPDAALETDCREALLGPSPSAGLGLDGFAGLLTRFDRAARLQLFVYNGRDFRPTPRSMTSGGDSSYQLLSVPIADKVVPFRKGAS
jgi:hypothetical protein